jgi:hypothetical protein
VLGQERPPVVPVVAEGLERAEELQLRLERLRRRAERAQRDSAGRILGQVAQRRERRLQVAVEAHRPARDRNAALERRVDQRQRRAQFASDEPHLARQPLAVDQERPLDRE